MLVPNAEPKDQIGILNRFDIEEAEGWDMRNYRTLLLKYNLLRLPPDVAEKISDFLKIQEQYRRWASEWVNGGSLPPERTLRRFARKLLYAAKASKWFGGLKKNGIKVEKMQPPLTFDAQLRLNNERDVSSGVFVDLPRRELRIRRWSNQRGNTIVLPLSEHAVKWILERVKEGGKLVLAAVWVGRSRRNHAVKLYVALTFRREVTPVQPKRLLVIDFNALHNGVSYAVVEGEKIVTKGVLRPDTSKILHLQSTAARLDSLCTNRDVMCDAATATKSRVWRILRSWEDEAVKKLTRLALQYKAAIIVDLPRDKSIRKLKESYASEKKIFLNFGRLWERLRGLAEWHGVPCHSARLYSTICPHCERKMSILQGRRVRCAACGFEANRDEVPALWAVRLFPKLSSFSSPFPAWACGAPGLFCLQKLIL